MIVFLSGKISDPDLKQVQRNRREFTFAKNQLKQIAPDCVVINPATLPLGMKHDQYMKICFAMVEVCDVLVWLPGCDKSLGSTMEMEYAQSIGKRIMAHEEVLKNGFC